MTAPVPPPVKRPWWKAGWALMAAGGVAGLAIGAGAGASASGNKGDAAPAPTVTAHATVTRTASATVTATPTVIRTVATKVKTATVTYTPPVKIAFGDGTFRVGSEIKPGSYHTDGVGDGAGCYWERDSASDGIDSIIANDNITGPTTIEIRSGDFAFKSSGGCEWSRVG